MSYPPRLPYGAVYFRKSNPPRADWARDYRTAAEDGMNTFRHWFLWSAIEVAPGEYDWEEYDRQLDLAAENGIQTILAEMITAAPEWAWRQLEHARIETAEGRRLHSQMSGSWRARSDTPYHPDHEFSTFHNSCDLFLRRAKFSGTLRPRTCLLLTMPSNA